MNKKPPSREKLNEAVEKILSDYPIENLSLSRILKLLEAKFVVPLSESVDNVKLAIVQSSQFQQFQSLHMSCKEVSYDILMASVWDPRCHGDFLNTKPWILSLLFDSVLLIAFEFPSLIHLIKLQSNHDRYRITIENCRSSEAYTSSMCSQQEPNNFHTDGPPITPWVTKQVR
jgi:hypothetical protein